MHDIFSRLGCSDTQSKLYLMLLENGPSIASMLAKRTRIKRVTVYGALEGLMEKGLVETYQRNKVHYFQAVDPEVIAEKCDQLFQVERSFHKRAQEVVKELKKLQQSCHPHIMDLKGIVQYYEGDEAVKTLIQETLQFPEKMQYCIGLSGYHVLQMEGDWKRYIHSRLKTGMKVKSLQLDSEEAREYQSRDKSELRETRLIQHKKFPQEGELNIIGDKIILYTSEAGEATGVKIRNKKIANILKQLFEIAWDFSGR